MNKWGIIRISVSNTKTMKKHAKITHVAAAAKRKIIILPTLAVISLLVVGNSVIPRVWATDYDAQIKALQAQNAQNNDVVADLRNKATSYQDAISQLQSQIQTLQGQIDSNVARQNDLQSQIDANQVELDKQKKILGENIKVMYVDGQPTTIEMLASSKNLSEFVDKEEYRNSVRNKVQTTLKKIADLQNQLNGQKKEVQALLDSQKAQQAKLDSARAEQASLLAYNESQQASYNQETKNNQSKIADLRRQQAAENARLFSGNGSKIIAGNNGNDSYPTAWRNAAQDSLVDNWGMYNRECVSYTAWKVYESGRNMPYWGGYGNANQWDDNARAAGIPVDTSPRQGDVAIKNSGPYGHAMYVEHVYSDGSIYISQYNASLDGTYSEAIISASAVASMNLQFIHFR